jgi:hypothetical protein
VNWNKGRSIQRKKSAQNTHSGTFMAGPATFPRTATGDTPSSVVCSDFNGDGKTDLALLDGGVTILLGNLTDEELMRIIAAGLEKTE